MKSVSGDTFKVLFRSVSHAHTPTLSQTHYFKPTHLDIHTNSPSQQGWDYRFSTYYLSMSLSDTSTQTCVEGVIYQSCYHINKLPTLAQIGSDLVKLLSLLGAIHCIIREITFITQRGTFTGKTHIH